MPKDPKKNVDRYKIRGGDLNEFEFSQNQGQFAEAQTTPTNLIPGTPPEAKAHLIAMKTQKRSTRKPTKAAKTAGTKKSSKPAGSKKSAKRATAKKSAAKKSAKKAGKKSTKKAAKK